MSRTPELAGEQVEIDGVCEIPPELVEERAEIDRIDRGIVDLLALRAERVDCVVTIKQAYGLEAHQPNRFAEMIADLQAYGASVGISPELINGIWEVIHKDSMASQREQTLGEDNQL